MKLPEMCNHLLFQGVEVQDEQVGVIESKNLSLYCCFSRKSKETIGFCLICIFIIAVRWQF